MTHPNRKTIYVERDIQKGIIGRFLMYIAFAFFFITLPVSFGRAWLDPTQLWVTHFFNVWIENWPLLLCLALFVPFAVIDLLRYSRRRLQAALVERAKGYVSYVMYISALL